MIRQLMRFSLVDSFVPRTRGTGSPGDQSDYPSGKIPVVPLKRVLGFCALIILLLTASVPLHAQNGKYTISGYIKDQASGEALINATVSIPSANVAVMTNAYGFYSITLPAGNYNLQATYSGYKIIQKEVKLSGNMTLDLPLQTSASLEQVVITGEKSCAAPIQ